MEKNISIITCIIILFLLPYFADGQTRDSINPNHTTSSDTSSLAIPKEEISDTLTLLRNMIPTDSLILKDFFNSDIPYNWISYRAHMQVSVEGSKYNFQIFYVNRIDSIIYVNIHISGIELARLTATPEEVIFVNKMSKEYYKGDYQRLTSLFGVSINFNMLQALFNGVDFKDFNSDFVMADLTTELQWIANQRHHLQENISLNQILTFNNALQLQKTHLEFEKSKTVFTMEYDKYTEGEFSFFQNFSISIPNISLKAFGEVQNLKFNTTGPTGIKIPDSFKPINP